MIDKGAGAHACSFADQSVSSCAGDVFVSIKADTSVERVTSGHPFSFMGQADNLPVAASTSIPIGGIGKDMQGLSPANALNCCDLSQRHILQKIPPCHVRTCISYPYNKEQKGILSRVPAGCRGAKQSGAAHQKNC